MPIPAEHRQIAIERFGYDLDGEKGAAYEEEYESQKARCIELGTVLGYQQFSFDVGGLRVLAKPPGKDTMLVLAQGGDPMNLWAIAYQRLHYLHLPPKTLGPLEKLIRWLSGEDLK